MTHSNTQYSLRKTIHLTFNTQKSFDFQNDKVYDVKLNSKYYSHTFNFITIQHIENNSISILIHMRDKTQQPNTYIKQKNYWFIKMCIIGPYQLIKWFIIQIEI